MKATKKSKAEKLKQSDRDVAEEALEIAIKNAPLDPETIKALRLICKRTKTAADARVKEFTLSTDQEPGAVQRSGLLNNITRLDIDYDLMPSDDELQHPAKLSRALGLLNLAVESCKSLKVLKVGISASPQIILACACILGNCVWKSLKDLIMLESYSMPGFLAGMLARPGCLPALKELYLGDLSAFDIEALHSSEFIHNLTTLFVEWSHDAYDINISPAMVAAVRRLLQKTANLDYLHVTSSTFEFLDCENFASLRTLHLGMPYNEDDDGEEVDFAPALAQPWTALETLSIDFALLTGPNLVRIFEAEDTLPLLKELTIKVSSFEVDDALSCVRRPHLKTFIFDECCGGYELIIKLAQFMKEDTSSLPSLGVFSMNCVDEDPIASVGALSEFLSCPQMATLEELTIQAASIGDNISILCKIANHCPKLKLLDLSKNKLGRSAVAFLNGFGNMGAFPQLEKLVILKQDTDAGNIDAFDAEHPFMPPLDVQETLRRVWPGLKCS